jgi:hypothetical protein
MHRLMIPSRIAEAIKHDGAAEIVIIRTLRSQTQSKF